MKTGMNLLLWTTHVTSEHFPLFAKLKETGFDGVELPVFEGDAAHYREIATELKNQGLECTTVTVVGEDANPISPDAQIRQAAVDRHKWVIEMTGILGGQYLCGPYHSPLAVFSRPPLTLESPPEASFTMPPLTLERRPLAVLLPPPLTLERTPLALLLKPPLTLEAKPLAVLPSPPLTEEPTPLATLALPPLTEE